MFKGVFFSLLLLLMPEHCTPTHCCHPAEVPYKNDRAGHRPPSSPLATPASWGDATPAAATQASIWARIHVQVCVPVTCQESCASQRKPLVGRLSKSKGKHRRARRSSAQILKWRCSPGAARVTGKKTHPSTKKEKKRKIERQACLYFSCFEKPSQHQLNSVCSVPWRFSHTCTGIF